MPQCAALTASPGEVIALMTLSTVHVPSSVTGGDALSGTVQRLAFTETEVRTRSMSSRP